MKVEDNILDAADRRSWSSSRLPRAARRDRRAGTPPARCIKRGIAITPVKFGISFTATFFNQAGALVHVYTDGSVQVNHGGTEMGQGLNTKVAQIVADELGVPFERVRSTATDTSKVPNTSATAASSGTDLNGRAAQYAARKCATTWRSSSRELDGCGAGAVRFADGQRAASAEDARALRRGGRGRPTPTASSCGATASTARPRSTTTRPR